MPQPPLAAFMELWYNALEAEHGIVIVTSDPRWLRQTLWNARKVAQDARLETLTVITPPTPNEVWIVRKGVNDKD